MLAERLNQDGMAATRLAVLQAGAQVSVLDAYEERLDGFSRSKRVVGVSVSVSVCVFGEHACTLCYVLRDAVISMLSLSLSCLSLPSCILVRSVITITGCSWTATWPLRALALLRLVATRPHEQQEEHFDESKHHLTPVILPRSTIAAAVVEGVPCTLASSSRQDHFKHPRWP